MGCAQIVFAFFRVRLYLLWSRRPDQKDHVAFVSWSVLIVLCCITEYSLIHPTTPLPTCLLFLFLFFVCFCFYFHYSLTYSLSSMVDSFVCFFYRTSLTCFESCTKKAVPALLRPCCVSNDS